MARKTNKARRDRAIALRRAGKTHKEIAVALGCSLSTVGRWMGWLRRNEGHAVASPAPPPPALSDGPTANRLRARLYAIEKELGVRIYSVDYDVPSARTLIVRRRTAGR
jgi:transposase